MRLELDNEQTEGLVTVLRRRHRQVPGTREQVVITSILREVEAARAAEALGIADDPEEGREVTWKNSEARHAAYRPVKSS